MKRLISSVVFLILFYYYPQCILAQDTINLKSGWNMIGGTSKQTPATMISDPPGIVISNYFGYSNSGYTVTDTLEKGKGYWVKTSQTGFFLTVNQPPAIPFNPFPNDNITDVSTSPVLIWSCTDPDNAILMYDVYFGTDNPPATKVSSGQSSAYVSLSNLNYNATYYWKVVAKDNHNDSAIGPVWQFTTSAPLNLPPANPSIPIPSDNDTAVSTTQTLNWSCSEPDGDPLTYDVYFGTDNPPATIVSSAQTGTSLTRSGLSDGTTYYWKVVAKDNHGASTEGQVWRYTTAFGFACTSQITYSGKTYNIVQIGTRCWFKENLDVGTMVTGSTEQTNNSTIEKYCYDDNPANCTTYGGLYKWNEAMQYSTTSGAQGICPTNWHIPTLAEYQTLQTLVSNDGNTLKAVGQGAGGGAGTNTSGFSALLSGYRVYVGGFGGLTYFTDFWSSTEDDATDAYLLNLNYDDSDIQVYDDNKGWGFSVRCLKD